ncbi:hypothetical protein EBR57_06740 [bacterium]|nr:hypothetical protein [bacterium]
MKKCVELELSRSHVVLTENWQSFELAGLLRNRDVQAQFCHVIGSRGLRIMVNSDICQANRVQWLGLTITHYEPDPLIYLPFIDYVLGQGIQIRSVSIAGIDPFYRWIRWADAVVVAKSGKMYFSDASTRFAPAQWGGTFEASILDILEQSATGRILEYDPTTSVTRIVAQGLSFANASIDVLRGCSSRVTSTASPFFCAMLTGVISDSK